MIGGLKNVLVLLTFIVFNQATITVYDNTTNTASLLTQIEAMAANCSAAPISTLNLCNSTCQTCQATNPSLCSTCSTGYTLTSGGDCRLNTSLFNYTYNNYVGGSEQENNIKALNQFTFDSSGQTLNIEELCSVCKYGTYQFFTAGLFKSTEVISLKITRVDPIDQIQIKFNFASVVQNMKLFITLNDNQLFAQQFTGFSDLTGTFARSNSVSNRSFLTLDALTTSTVSSIWVPVDTGLISYIVTNYTIKIYVETNSTQTYVWGFNDMVILVRDCQTCLSQSVKDLIATTGAAIGVTFFIVVILIVVLFVAIAIEEYRRKVEFQESLGASSSGSNLPLKAVDRVIASIAQIRKARQKEWAAWDKKLETSKKNINKLFTKRPNTKTMALS